MTMIHTPKVAVLSTRCNKTDSELEEEINEKIEAIDPHKILNISCNAKNSTEVVFTILYTERTKG